MIIFNTTYIVSNSQYAKWLTWIKEEHIPYMIASGFSEPQIAKVLTVDKDQEGSSISVQFKMKELNDLMIWSEQNNDKISRALVQLFGNQVLSFSTVLEIID